MVTLGRLMMKYILAVLAGKTLLGSGGPVPDKGTKNMHWNTRSSISRVPTWTITMLQEPVDIVVSYDWPRGAAVVALLHARGQIEQSRRPQGFECSGDHPENR